MPAVPVHLVPRPHVIRPAPISHGETLPGCVPAQFCAVTACLGTARKSIDTSPKFPSAVMQEGSSLDRGVRCGRVGVPACPCASHPRMMVMRHVRTARHTHAV